MNNDFYLDITSKKKMSLSNVALIYDPKMAKHEHPDEDHVERPERISAIYNALNTNELTMLCTQIQSRKATKEEILWGHTSQYLDDLILKLTQPVTLKFEKYNKGDMFSNDYTLECAFLAAGSVIEMTNKILNNEYDRGFAIVRPPGHHATRGGCAGFCYFNNVALAALSATKQGKKVWIIDWDVHYHHGTHSILHDKENIMVYSIHRYDDGSFYPFKLKEGQSGITNAGGIGATFINDGFNGSQGDSYYLSSFVKYLLSSKYQTLKPDIILVSCGFDAALGDPLGDCLVTPKGYYEMTRILIDICPKVVLALEGGYNLESISRSAVACTRALLDLPFKKNTLTN